MKITHRGFVGILPVHLSDPTSPLPFVMPAHWLLLPLCAFLLMFENMGVKFKLHSVKPLKEYYFVRVRSMK